MTSIPSINIASSTASNWLKEAQESVAASQAPGGMMGALQDSRANAGSLKTFLAKSQNWSVNLALIAQNTAQSAGSLAAQMAVAATQKRAADLAALAQKLNPQPQNFNPPAQLDSILYFGNGSTLDTGNNILTLADGTQIDTTTGRLYVDESAVIRMASGAYLDTKNNILTLADGTRIDTVTHLTITA